MRIPRRYSLVKDRLKCGWGNFSLVDAVVRSLRVIRREKLDCDRVMLISGACMPIRPLRELSQFLDAHPKTEFIEAYDSNWMIGGLRKERYQYWHFFNHQTHQKLFNWHFQLQRMFWPKRRFPRSLEPRFGSQWWCLSWKLCEKILDHIQKHPLTYFFFSTTWIPDELYFQDHGLQVHAYRQPGAAQPDLLPLQRLGQADRASRRPYRDAARPPLLLRPQGLVLGEEAAGAPGRDGQGAGAGGAAEDRFQHPLRLPLQGEDRSAAKGIAAHARPVPASQYRAVVRHPGELPEELRDSLRAAEACAPGVGRDPRRGRPDGARPRVASGQGGFRIRRESVPRAACR
ncbi:MAG: beta-1,6-N-acetylglucosaminyltransferase [Rhizobium sp.]|nr:beta-1,6-N-acetylglucosaminyltransferase [Rhizobium sp.]